VALVTGASAGIGAAICRVLAEGGMKVVGCARRIEKIEELAKAQPGIIPYKCDLTSDSDIIKMYEWIESNSDLGKVDVCVPNAGFAASSSLLEGNPSEWRGMSEVNIIALNHCTQLAVRSMIKHKIDDGQVIFVNSMSGHRVAGGSKFYSATKFAVTALLEGWRMELFNQEETKHIRVAQISPGLVETEFSFVMNKGNEDKAESLYKSIQCLQAQDMADHVKYILETPKHVQITDILVRPTEQKS